VKDIIIERIQDCKNDLEKIKGNRLNKVINECDKFIDIFAENINDYCIDDEYMNFLILMCKLEKVKGEVNRVGNIVNKLIEDLRIFLKIYD